LRTVRKAADRLERGQSLEIAFDEWNVWHDWFTRPFEHAWAVGPIDGLYAATMLNVLCREAAPLKLTMAAFFEPVNEGAIEVQPDSARITSVGQVFGLYRAHHGNRQLPLKTSGKEASLDVCASIPPTDHSAVLTIVNTAPTGPREVQISLEGVSQLRGATARVLATRDLQAGTPFDDRTEHLEIAHGAVSLTLPRLSIGLVRLDLP
jgi:alpha-L-arabinofuranosidase